MARGARRAGRSRGMVEVELVGDEPPGVGPRPGPTESVRRAVRSAAALVVPRAVRAWRRPWARWVAVALVVAVVATLVGAPEVRAARDRTRLAALARVPGVLRPVRPTPQVLYRLDPAEGVALATGTLVGGTVVGALGTTAAGNDTQVVGLDAATGRRRWSVPLDPSGTDDLAEAMLQCGPAGTVAVCWAATPTPSTRVWAVDPVDGRVLHDATYGARSAATVADGLVVVAEQASGPARAPENGPWTVTWRVTGQDPVTGDARWTWTSPPDDVAPEQDTLDPRHVANDYGWRMWSASAAPPRTADVALRVGDDTWLLGTDGRQRLQLTRQGGWEVFTVRNGAVLREPLLHEAVDVSPAQDLLLADGTWLSVGGATTMWSNVDDGSTPGLVFLASGAGGGPDGSEAQSGGAPVPEPAAGAGAGMLWAVDRATGRTVWRHPLEGYDQGAYSLVLDGRLYVATDSLTALDAATGRVLWSVPGAGGWLATDGTALVVAGTDDAGSPSGLQAYALGSGRLLWSSDLTAQASAGGQPGGVGGALFGLPVPYVGVFRQDGSLTVVG